MAATDGSATPEGLASLERLKEVETESDTNLRMVRGKIDLTLSQLRADSEAQTQAAQKQAEEEASELLLKAQQDAEAAAARILAEAKANLEERSKAGLPELTRIWPEILNVLFSEFS
jgi:vacuolar-type H+-ATPase subunit H